jgi:hypothetical protein
LTDKAKIFAVLHKTDDWRLWFWLWAVSQWGSIWLLNGLRFDFWLTLRRLLLILDLRCLDWLGLSLLLWLLWLLLLNNLCNRSFAWFESYFMELMFFSVWASYNSRSSHVDFLLRSLRLLNRLSSSGFLILFLLISC